jgi:zinc finger CCHC domain-containing protein 9
MTRVTNFGRKRTYLEAGFHTQPEDHAQTQLPEADQRTSSNLAADPNANDASPNTTRTDPATAVVDSPSEPPKKKRKRGPKSRKPRPDGGDPANVSVSQAAIAGGHPDEMPKISSRGKKSDKKKKGGVCIPPLVPPMF